MNFTYELMEYWIAPVRANSTDSWIDFFSPSSAIIQPWENIIIPLWVKINLPEWYDMTFTNRSSLASKKSLVVGACLIDNGYRWELMVDIHNIWNWTQCIDQWDKIVQWVIRKVEYLTPIEWTVSNDTDRWEGWFWSTGI